MRLRTCSLCRSSKKFLSTWQRQPELEIRAPTGVCYVIGERDKRDLALWVVEEKERVAVPKLAALLREEGRYRRVPSRWDTEFGRWVSDVGVPRIVTTLAGIRTTAWRDGEVRPTHQARPKRRRHDWRTRPDPFEIYWPTVQGWLDSDPDRTARELFQRLLGKHSGVFPNGQLRTLQRRVKEWRSATARRLVFAGLDAEDASADPLTVSAANRREPDIT